MTARLVEDGSLRFERTLREWAFSNEQIADAVTTSDLRVFELAQRALTDLGHPADEARLRAGIVVHSGIGFAQGNGRLRPRQGTISGGSSTSCSRCRATRPDGPPAGTAGPSTRTAQASVRTSVPS